MVDALIVVSLFVAVSIILAPCFQYPTFKHLSKNVEKQNESKIQSVLPSGLTEQDYNFFRLAIHDGPAQLLSVAQIELEGLMNKDDSPIEKDELQNVWMLLSAGLEDLSKLLSEEPPKKIATELMCHFLEELISQMKLFFPAMSFELVMSIAWPELSEEKNHHLYNMIREGIINSCRHARATCSTTIVYQEAHNLFVEVMDNGSANTPFAEGTGMSGIKERASRIGAHVEWKRYAHGGTILRISTPLRISNLGTKVQEQSLNRSED